MATEKDFELLDDYVANRLGGEDKSAFENKLQGDPDLQREHMIQQRLVKAIKDARVAELKSMLNNTPIPATNYGGSSAVGKIAVGTFVAGLVATGIYFYFNQDEESSSPVEQTIELKTEGRGETMPKEGGPVTIENESTAVETEGTTSESISEAAKETTAETASVKKPVIDVYDPTAETSADVEEPAGERRSSVRTGAPAITVQIDRQNKKYNFNYQFTDGKLLLYGPFEQNLYEILEFFSDEKRTVFLFHKEKYYLLNDDNENVQTLSPITDVNLIKKLKEYREN